MELKSIVQVLSGLALFLFGMKMMSENLESVAGHKMKKIIGMFTSNPIRGILVGAVVTALVQSSSATTVMVIGFVNAGIMSLYQAIGIIMGANIGTTITGQMVSLKLSALAPYAIIIGGLGLMLISKKSKQNRFYIILGFGILFMGMDIMGDAMSPLRQSPAVAGIIQSLSEPGVVNTLLGLILGAAITAVIQSSSAVTAIVVAMAGSGAIGIAAAFPIVLGANIGTTVTAILSSIGASKTAKKAALMHLLFNVIGSVIFIILYIIFRGPALKLMNMLGANAKRQIANTHTIFNVLNTLMLFPFAKGLVALVNRLIPGEENEESVLRLDERMIETPSVAIEMVKTEIDRMGAMALESYDYSMDAYLTKDAKSVQKVYEIEKVINEMEHGINDYLIKLSAPTSLSTEQKSYIDNMFNVINDIERIGDHAENVAGLANQAIKDGVVSSDKALKQVAGMSGKVRKSIVQSLKALAKEDKKSANKVIKRENKVDKIEKTMRKEHIKRLQEGLCKPEAGIIFLDVISNLERVADHAENISEYVNDIEIDAGMF